MKYVLFLVLLVFLINQITSSENKFDCEQYSNLEDREIIRRIKSHADLEFQEKFKVCIELFIKKGHYDALEFYLNELLKRGIKFKTELNQAIDSYNTFLNNLKNKFKFKETEYQKATPAIRWAQNKDYVFLEIKFSHRHDSPGCPEVEEEFFDIVNGNEIMFQAYCSIGDIPIKFDFHLKLFDEVIKLRSHWGVSSAQKFHVTMKKSVPGKEWNTLFKEGVVVPNNIQKWFEMEEKFKDNKEEETAEEDDDDFNIKPTEKKKKRKKTDFHPILGKK